MKRILVFVLLSSCAAPSDETQEPRDEHSSDSEMQGDEEDGAPAEPARLLAEEVVVAAPVSEVCSDQLSCNNSTVSRGTTVRSTIVNADSKLGRRREANTDRATKTEATTTAKPTQPTTRTTPLVPGQAFPLL